VTEGNPGPAGRQGISLRQRLAAYALSLAGGLGVNALSGDLGYRGAAAAAAAILVSTNWLRQLPPRAPLVRMVSRALLGGAAIAAVVAAASPSREGLATITATALTISTLLIASDLPQATRILGGTALIGLDVAFLHESVVILAVLGFGVAFLRLGAASLRTGKILRGVAVIGLGVVAFIAVVVGFLLVSDDILSVISVLSLGAGIAALGVAVLRYSKTLTWVAFLIFGVGIMGLGGFFLRGDDVRSGGSALDGVAFLVFGAAFSISWGAVIVRDIAVQRNSKVLGRIVPFGRAVGFIGGAAALFVGGAVSLREGKIPDGVTILAFGAVYLVVLGAAVLRRSKVLVGVWFLASGIVSFGGWVADLPNSDVFDGVVGIGLGSAFLVYGVALLRDSAVLAGIAVVDLGVGAIVLGVAGLRSGYTLGGVAGIVLGAGVLVLGGAIMHGSSIFAHALTWLMSLTRTPDSETPHSDDQRTLDPTTRATEAHRNHLYRDPN
jgi:hypothetical protein